jgi:heptosyltransferase I
MMSAIGDSVQVLPVVNALRRAWPEVHITWLIQPGPHALVGGHPGVDEFILYPRTRGLAAWEAVRRVAEKLRAAAQELPRGRFDLLLALQVYFKAGIFAGLAPASVKLGFDRLRARDLNWVFTTHRIPCHPDGFAHIQDQYFEFLDVLGVDPNPVSYGLTLSDDEEEARRDFFARIDGPACSLVMGTSDPRKDWTPDGYAQVVDALEEELGLRTILLGGPGAAEARMARETMEKARTRPVLALGDGIRRLLWVLSGSDLVVSPDTGPLHMARAMDVPVVGLYGYTNPKRYGPYRRFTDLVVDGYARFPGEPYPVCMERRRDGMGRVTPEGVLEKVRLAMDRYVGPSG